MSNTAVIPSKWKPVAVDFLILLLVYFIPALSHVTPFPLYYLDPMRLLLLTGYLLSRNPVNAYILAVTIPLFSMLVTGHPVFYKSLLISFELLSNMLFFHFLLSKTKWPAAVLIFISIIFAKLIYYGCKYIFIQAGLIEGGLIATGLLTQLWVITGLSLLFGLLYKRRTA